MKEQRWLPALAPRLPLPVPAPVRTGRPGRGYPWWWSIVAFLPGRVAGETPPVDFHEAAVVLGRFLGVLHDTAPPDAPANPYRGIPLIERDPDVTARVGQLAGMLDRAAVLRVWSAAVAAPGPTGPPRWLHGDLHPGNLLVDDGRISAVIDFGDLTAGDPAVDLAIAWMLLPAACHATFRLSYRAAGGDTVDEHTWLRTRGWALTLALAMLARSADNPLMARVARRTLDAVLA